MAEARDYSDTWKTIFQEEKISAVISLGDTHLGFFKRAISNVLSTEIAEITYAQIIDGLPLSSVAMDLGSGWLEQDNPIRDQHKALCPGVIEKVHEFRANFDSGALQLNVSLISQFRAAAPGSRAFKTRLIEIVAEAVHEIAVQLFNMGTSFHVGDAISTWIPPKDARFWTWYSEPWPTMFRHAWYVDYDQYPNGIADMAGFWAESRILGGVVVFDRRDPAKVLEADPHSVWFHSDRRRVTYRLYQLHDEQKQQLLEFLTSESPNLQLLPILGDKTNDRREDPEEPIEEIGLYRHKWDRKPLSRDAGDSRMRDVLDRLHYPLTSDYFRAQDRAYARKERIADERRAEWRAAGGRTPPGPF